MTNTDLAIPSPSVAGALLRISAEQYHQMIEQAIIPEDSSAELLNGLMVNRDRADVGVEGMHGPKHRLAVRLLVKLTARIDSEGRHFQMQLPIDVSPFNEPEPDGAVILGADRDFADHLPPAAKVASVIEVASSSLERDTHDKSAIYASAEIPQYVIVNLRDDRIESYSNPDAAAGLYHNRLIVLRNGMLRLELGGGTFLEIAAGDLLP